MNRLWIFLYLLALMVYTLLGTPLAPFHGDESTLIYASRDYFDQFVARDLPRVMNLAGDDAMDQRLRLLDGRVQKYLGGFAYHLTGGTADSLNKPWLWGADWTYNLENGHIPTSDLLMAQRWAMALLLALSVPAAYAVGAQAGGIAGGLLMATLIAVSPNLLINGRRAMMEAPLLLFTLVTVLAGLKLVSSFQFPVSSKDRQRPVSGDQLPAAEHPSVGTPYMASLRHTPLVWTMLLGISAGLTVASKHSGAFSVAPLFAALGLLALIRRDGRGIGRLVLSGVIALGVFIALNPAWWPAPIDIAREVLRLRSELLAEQTASFGGYVTLGDQVSGFVQYAIAETPQYYEVDGWQDWIGGQIAAYESSPWTPPPLLNIVRAVVLIVCMALGVIAVIRRRREPGVMVAALWIAGVVLAVFALTPLPWARYYLPALPALYTLAALGIGSIRKR